MSQRRRPPLADPAPARPARRRHRPPGARRDVPENTLPAFAAAWEAGAWVEADTQPTADGVPVILHDDDLDRTTSGSGPVATHTVAEVSGLDIIRGLARLRSTVAGGAARPDCRRARACCWRSRATHQPRRCRARSSGSASRRARRPGVPAVVRGAGAANISGRWRRTGPFGLLVERLDADPVARCRELGRPPTTRPTGTVLGAPAGGGRPACGRDHRRGVDLDDPAGVGALTEAGVDAIITDTPADTAGTRARARLSTART